MKSDQEREGEEHQEIPQDVALEVMRAVLQSEEHHNRDGDDGHYVRDINDRQERHVPRPRHVVVELEHEENKHPYAVQAEHHVAYGLHLVFRTTTPAAAKQDPKEDE